jgi:transposase-like protein
MIASTYLAGTNTRRVRRALAALFGGTVGKDTVSRTWRKVKSDWDAWNTRSLAEEPVVRLILDGTVVRVRLDRKATSISLLVVLGVRADGQKVLLAIKSMGGESDGRRRPLVLRRGLHGQSQSVQDCEIGKSGGAVASRSNPIGRRQAQLVAEFGNRTLSEIRKAHQRLVRHLAHFAHGFQAGCSQRILDPRGK